MSPTPIQRPSDASIQEFRRIGEELRNAALSTDDDLQGCSDEEIAQIERGAPFPLPDEYLAFLKVMGRRCRPIFVGENVNYPGSLEAPDAAEDVAGGDSESLTLDHRFFFGHHQGYIVYFFEDGSPAVFGYKEGDPTIHRLAETFSTWMWQLLSNAKERRVENARVDAEIEAKRAALRAEGKIDW